MLKIGKDAKYVIYVEFVYIYVFLCEWYIGNLEWRKEKGMWGFIGKWDGESWDRNSEKSKFTFFPYIVNLSLFSFCLRMEYVVQKDGRKQIQKFQVPVTLVKFNNVQKQNLAPPDQYNNSQ